MNGCKCTPGRVGHSCRFSADEVAEWEQDNIHSPRDERGTTALVATVVVLCILAFGWVGFMIRRERQGKPLFVSVSMVAPDDISLDIGPQVART